MKEKVLEGELLKHYATSGNWWADYSPFTIKVTITYPVGYKDLCILACGNSDRMNADGTDEQFKNSQIKDFYDLTSWYSKTDKSVCHGMRVK